MTAYKTAMALMVLLLTMILPATAHACVAVTTSGPGTINYDPTNPAPTIRAFQVRLQENCGRSAATGAVPVQIWFSDDIEPQPYGEVGGIPFSISNRNLDFFSTPIAPIRTPLALNFTPISDVIDFEVSLSPRMLARSGVRQIALNWSTLDEFGEAVTGSVPVLISVRLLPAFRLEIAGGGDRRRMDFGSLSAGDTRTVNLTALATQPFRIGMRSVYQGQMRRAEPCGIPMPAPLDEADFVAYQATLAGNPINETAPFQDLSLDGETTRSFSAIPFRVQIDPTLDPTRKRAGRYCDVITLTISPAN